MDAFRKTQLRLLAMTAAVLVALGGCAGGLGKDECRTADWRTVGYEDGVHGFAADRIGAHRSACARYQVSPDLAAYMQGRELGLLEYCQPRNGYRAGLGGRTYANVCSDATEPGFLDGYRHGRQIHDARVDLSDTQGRLRGAQSALAQTEAAMIAVTAESVQPDVPPARRLFLAQELVRLAEERSELQARITKLSLRTRELVGVVRELERQNPYAL
jgi:hypothetical protein